MSEEIMSFKDKLSQIPDAPAIQPLPIIHDIEVIKQISEDATLDEAELIWPILEASLDPNTGYGLSAIQIGIPKKVAFVLYQGKSYRLLNTRIIEYENKTIMHGEGCLTIPGKHINTERYTNITVEDDMIGKVILDEQTDGLLPVIFQHEVDHFNGNTILDRRQVPIKRLSPKIRRNDPCPCGSGKKYKKCCF